MSDNANTTQLLFERLRVPKNQAEVEDLIEESLIEVDKFQRLDLMADREFALEHNMFSEESGDVAILCKRSGDACEQTYFFSGVVVYASFLPYLSFKDLNKNEPWSLPAHQSLVVTVFGTKHNALLHRAFDNFYVMARLRRPEGTLKPLNHLLIDGVEAFCARTPISTPRTRMYEDDVPLTLTDKQDPRGIVRQYLTQRNLVVLEDNQVDVFTSKHLEKAGEYEITGDGIEGASVRPGQIVRVEVGFRIVPAGREYNLRVDLKSVVIIHDDISTKMAFAESDAGVTAKNTISVSSAGPSGVHIESRKTIKRASRMRRKAKVGKMDIDTGLSALPFSSAPSTTGA